MATDLLERIEKAVEAAQPAPQPAPAPAPAPTNIPAPKVEAPAHKEEDDIPAEVKSEAGRKSWRDYKAATKKQVDGYESRIREMEAKVAAAAGSPEQQAKLEKKIADLEKEREDMTERLGRASLEQTKEFQRHYVSEVQAKIDEAKAIVGTAKAGVLDQLLRMPAGDIQSASLNEFIGDLNELQKTELVVLMRELRGIERDKAQKLAGWKEQLALKREIDERNQQEHSKKILATFDSELADAAKSNAALQPRDGDDSWNGRVKNSVEAARQIYRGEGTPQERARASLMAVTAPLVIEQLIEAQKQIEALKGQVTAVRANAPKVGDTGPESQVHPQGKAESLVDRIARLAKESGGVR